MKTLQQIIKQRQDEFKEKFIRSDGLMDKYVYVTNENAEQGYDVLTTAECISSHNQETVVAILEAVYGSEIQYWKDVFNKRPKDRDLESDNIAQNFARIEIERLENKLFSTLQDIKNNQK